MPCITDPALEGLPGRQGPRMGVLAYDADSEAMKANYKP
jgi:hypothetical protein